MNYQHMKKSRLAKQVYIISKIFRLRPVIAWSVTSFILVLSAGIHDDLNPDFTLALLSLLVVVIMQGLSSHAINDIADEKVDKSADIKGTGRHKLLVSGEIIKRNMFIIFALSLYVSVMIGIFIYTIRGNVILYLLAFGIFFIYSYNFKPLKLNYKPFSEFTVVLPIIIFISLGFSYSIFGDISNNILYVAVVNAFMNMSWYHFSRLQDIKPDMANRKITSMVWAYENFGRKTANLFVYIGASLLIYAFLIFLIFGTFYCITSIMIVSYLGSLSHVMDTTTYTISSLSAKMRRIGMYISYINCMLLSSTLLLYKYFNI